jgi:flagellar motility protein MotE (MotC chaperone)
MSDTPRTDAAYSASVGAASYELLIEARDLERELAAANERIRRLEEAGDEMAWCLGEQNHFVAAWRQAKEAKP